MLTVAAEVTPTAEEATATAQSSGLATAIVRSFSTLDKELYPDGFSTVR